MTNLHIPNKILSQEVYNNIQLYTWSGNLESKALPQTNICHIRLLTFTTYTILTYNQTSVEASMGESFSSNVLPKANTSEPQLINTTLTRKLTSQSANVNNISHLCQAFYV